MNSLHFNKRLRNDSDFVRFDRVQKQTFRKISYHGEYRWRGKPVDCTAAAFNYIFDCTSLVSCHLSIVHLAKSFVYENLFRYKNTRKWSFGVIACIIKCVYNLMLYNLMFSFLLCIICNQLPFCIHMSIFSA